MDSTKIQQCDECAQVWRIEKVDVMTANVPQFCPFCGAKASRFIRSHFTSFDAKCFKGINDELLRLVYVDWGVNAHDERVNFPNFVDYFWHVIKEG